MQPMEIHKTIKSIKQEILDQAGYFIDQYQLRLDGKQLEDNYELSDYGFKFSSRLLLMMCFQG